MRKQAQYLHLIQVLLCKIHKGFQKSLNTVSTLKEKRKANKKQSRKTEINIRVEINKMDNRKNK